MKKKSFIYFLAFLFVSCQSEKIERSLIDDFSFNIPLVNEIEDLFGNTGRMIQLDTIMEAFVGRIGKIIKHENHFFILSDDQRILHFDNDGKFISKLDKRGGGPGEYTRLDDFNLIKINGNTELWICDFKRIRKYVLSGNSWDFVGTIEFGFVINKFKIILNEHILIATGQNDESLLLTDITGVPLRKYLKKEIPFLIFRAIQFVNYDSCIIFQLGVSNEAIEFNTKDYSFEHINIVNNERFLSSKSLLDMFNRFGQEYIGELSKTNYIRGFNKVGDNSWLEYYQDGERFVAVKQKGVWKKMKVDIKNNFSMATLAFSESFDSFIRYEYPEDDHLNLLLNEYMLFDLMPK